MLFFRTFCIFWPLKRIFCIVAKKLVLPSFVTNTENKGWIMGMYQKHTPREFYTFVYFPLQTSTKMETPLRLWLRNDPFTIGALQVTPHPKLSLHVSTIQSTLYCQDFQRRYVNQKILTHVLHSNFRGEESPQFDSSNGSLKYRLIK